MRVGGGIARGRRGVAVEVRALEEGVLEVEEEVLWEVRGGGGSAGGRGSCACRSARALEEEKEVGASKVGVLKVGVWRRIARKLAVDVVTRCYE